jgi:hypothetical protein
MTLRGIGRNAERSTSMQSLSSATSATSPRMRI